MLKALRLRAARIGGNVVDRLVEADVGFLPVEEANELRAERIAYVAHRRPLSCIRSTAYRVPHPLPAGRVRNCNRHLSLDALPSILFATLHTLLRNRPC